MGLEWASMGIMRNSRASCLREPARCTDSFNSPGGRDPIRDQVRMQVELPFGKWALLVSTLT